MANGQIVHNSFRTLVTAYLVTVNTVYLGVGTGATTPAHGGTPLATEVTTASLSGGTYTRPGAITPTLQTTSFSNDTTQWQATWTNPSGSANTPAVTEACIFSAVTSGTPYWWANFAAINVPPSGGIQVTAQAVFA